MLSSLDVTRILAESSAQLAKAEITGVEYFRKERTVRINIDGEKKYCLIISFHPRWNGFFILPAGRCRLDTPEKPRPFARQIWSGTIISLRQKPNDRIVELEIKAGDAIYFLILEILGPNGNIRLLDSGKQLIASLRDRKYTAGQAYKPPPLPEKLDPAKTTVEDLRHLLEEKPGANPARLLEKNIYGIDYYLARFILRGAQKSSQALNNLPGIHRRLTDIIRACQTSDRSIYVYRIRGNIAYYPVRFSDREPLSKSRSLSQAQREMIAAMKIETESEDFREKTVKSLENRIKKAERLLKRLEADIEEASGYERFLQLADLLKINLARLKRGMAVIVVDDLYHDGQSVEIPLDPKLTGQGNIIALARRYRKGKEGLSVLKRRRGNISRELENMKEAKQAFEDDFERARDNYQEYLPPAPSTPSERSTTSPTLPYKEYQTSTGLSVYVGKSGDNNDRTTFEYAKPYELWFHASQCPGSHVVMKLPHKNFKPSMREIEEVAAAAAYFSKARGSAGVPISYTLKKYVRKPRRAKAGLVTIERGKTVIVEPRKPEKKKY
jgi:predicted ribosome quality control (RQC) complex YloA/Tae2 family protein